MRRILLVVWAGLLTLIGLQWWDWPAKHQQATQVESSAANKQSSQAEEPLPPLLAHPQEDYQTISELCLFRVERIGFYPALETATESAVDTHPPKFKLLGVILTDQEPPAAMILKHQEKKSQIIHVGENVDGWVLKEITENGVVMSLNDNRVTIPLRPY
jgi:hypothetical protein